MRYYHFFAIAALIVVLLFLYDNATDDDMAVRERTEPLTSGAFDYYMNEVDSTRFTPDGRREWRLQTPRLTHFPDPEHTRLETPNIRLFPEDSQPWRITSTSARLDTHQETGDDRIIFRGDVVITHHDEQGRPLNIYTDSLTVYPERQFAETDADVLMTAPDSEVRSTGLRANLESKHIELLAKVRGFHE